MCVCVWNSAILLVGFCVSLFVCVWMSLYACGCLCELVRVWMSVCMLEAVLPTSESVCEYGYAYVCVRL